MMNDPRLLQKCYVLKSYVLVVTNIGGEMVIMLAFYRGSCGVEPKLGQTKIYKVGSRCFSAKHAAY